MTTTRIYTACLEHHDGKYYSYVLPLHHNILYEVEDAKKQGAICIHACCTRKEAEELADFWNSCCRHNGTYLFDKNRKEDVK